MTSRSGHLKSMRDIGAVQCSTGPMPTTAHPLRLVPVRHQDQAAAVAVHDDPTWAPFTFLYGYDPDRSWADYVSWLADVHRGVGLGPSEVPATFLLAWVDDELVGRTSIRHELNDYLEAAGFPHCSAPTLSPVRAGQVLLCWQRRGPTIEVWNRPGDRARTAVTTRPTSASTGREGDPMVGAKCLCPRAGIGL